MSGVIGEVCERDEEVEYGNGPMRVEAGNGK